MTIRLPFPSRLLGVLVLLGFWGLFSALPITDGQAWAQQSVTFRVIFVKEEDEAHRLFSRLRAGEPFWKLAIDYSQYPNAGLGGYVEEARLDELREEFREVLRRLPPGEVSPPIPTRGGYAILKRESPRRLKSAWVQAEGLFLQALRAGAQGDLPRARRLLSKVLSVYPNHRGALLTLEVVRALEAGRLKRSIGLEVLEGFLLAKEGFPRKALEPLQKAARGASQIGAIHLVLGEIYLENRQWGQAVAAYKKALSSPATSLLARISLGGISLHRGNLKEALKHYQKAVAMDPGAALAHVGLGLVYLGMGNPQEALREFRVALAIDPLLDPAYNEMGLVLLGQGKVQEAVWAFEKALSIRPDNPTYLNHLGFAYNRWGMFTKSVKILEKAVALAPMDPMIHNNLAVAYFDSGKIDKAIAHADRARQLGYRVHPDFLAKLKPYRKNRPSP